MSNQGAEADEAAFEERYFGDYSRHGSYRDAPLKRMFRTRLVRRFARSGRLLEIACAYGYILRALENDFECEGLDISEHAISVARTITKASVQCGDVEGILPEKQGDAYDVVLAFDVLEHIPESQVPGVLDQIARILRPGGILIMSVPNVGSLGASVRGGSWHGRRDPTHVSLLTPARWQELVGTRLSVLATGGDGLWDIPYVPFLPKAFQYPFLVTQFLAAVTRARFPRLLSENLLIVAAKR